MAPDADGEPPPGQSGHSVGDPTDQDTLQAGESSTTSGPSQPLTTSPIKAAFKPVSKYVAEAEVEPESSEAAGPPPGKKSRTNTPWTPAEERRLKQMRDAGKSWSEIAKVSSCRVMTRLRLWKVERDARVT